MKRSYTEADFADLSWHDCHIWGIELRTGDPHEWTSDLVLHLDFIVTWLCGPDGRATFEIAPATLVFHGVTGLQIAIDWSRDVSGAPAHDIAIHQIDRVEDRTQALRVPLYRWTIETNWPPDGRITFLATGFTQTLLADSVPCEQQHLSSRNRRALLKA
jgi:hypothetical protein